MSFIVKAKATLKIVMTFPGLREKSENRDNQGTNCQGTYSLGDELSRDDLTQCPPSMPWFLTMNQPEGHSAMDKALACHAASCGSNPDRPKILVLL